MKNRLKESVLITGASSGIGLELVKLFAQDGHDLVIVARNQKDLNALAADLEHQHAIKVIAIAMDLSEPGSAHRLQQRVGEHNLLIGTLINNAGYGLHGKFLDLDAIADQKMLHLNMMALTELTRLFAPAMVKRGHGQILNVASTASFQPGPLMSTYYASKAYVLSFSEALGNELKGTGVTVTALCPGPTASRFQERARIAGTRLLKLRVSTSEDVAKAGYKAMRRGKTVAVSGFLNQLLVASLRVTPRALVTKVSRMILEKN